jgi:hypothetical protein
VFAAALIVHRPDRPSTFSSGQSRFVPVPATLRDREKEN